MEEPVHTFMELCHGLRTSKTKKRKLKYYVILLLNPNLL